jgi:hypothetical protein
VVRETSLARIYDDLGFEHRALVEATKSLSEDPANYSAHRFPGVGPAEGAFNEFHPLFERNQAQLTATGVVGNNGTLDDEVVVSGLYNCVAFSAGQFHSESDGFRDNNEVRNNLYDVFAQGVLTPSFGL